MTVRLRTGAATDTGVVRTENQDHLLVTGGLWLVADGMGGHRGGEVASLVASEVVASAVADLGGHRLDDAVRRANGAVIDRALGDAELAGMGTTLTALALVAGADPSTDVLVLVNVGDSRTYRLAAGTSSVVQLTTDHSLVAEWEREGRITADQAATHPHRNVITRALGVDEEVEVDRWDLTPEEGDRYLLCSDGLTNELDDDAIAAVLVAFPDPQAAADELVERANAAGGRDNVTVVVVDVVEVVAPVGGGRPQAAGQEAAGPVPGSPPTDSGSVRRSRFTWRVALFLGALVVLVGATVGAVAYWARGMYFVGAGGSDGGEVVVFQGQPGGVLWFDPTVVESTGLEVADLPLPERQRVQEGHVEVTLDGARRYVDTLASRIASTPSTSTTAPPTTAPPVPTTEPPVAPTPPVTVTLGA